MLKVFMVVFKSGVAICLPLLRRLSCGWGVLAMMEGMWNDYLMHQKSFQRDTAERAIFRVLSSLFPKHFDLYGALDG